MQSHKKKKNIYLITSSSTILFLLKTYKRLFNIYELNLITRNLKKNFEYYNRQHENNCHLLLKKFIIWRQWGILISHPEIAYFDIRVMPKKNASRQIQQKM